MSFGCGKVIGRSRPGGVTYKCGRWGVGGYEFCDECYDKYESEYPQGWVAYPGDVCEHGTYVGGIGRDHLCFECEMGE